MHSFKNWKEVNQNDNDNVTMVDMVLTFIFYIFLKVADTFIKIYICVYFLPALATWT